MAELQDRIVPMKIVVNNCGASLDTVTFRGIPREQAAGVVKGFTFLSGSLDEWAKRGDAALVGEALAARRRITVGQTLAAAGISAYVAGIIRSDEPQDQNVAYVDLPFLQRAAARGAVLVDVVQPRLARVGQGLQLAGGAAGGAPGLAEHEVRVTPPGLTCCVLLNTRPKPSWVQVVLPDSSVINAV